MRDQRTSDRFGDFIQGICIAYGLAVCFTLLPIIPAVVLIAGEVTGWHPGWLYFYVAGVGPLAASILFALRPMKENMS